MIKFIEITDHNKVIVRLFDRELSISEDVTERKKSSHREKNWGDQRGLNPRQPESQSGALPTELWPPQKSKRLCSYIELCR